MKTLQEMPEFMTAKHLVELGLYQSVGAIYVHKKRKTGSIPNHINIGRKILYPKSEVTKFVNKLLVKEIDTVLEQE